jgi:hypothetical protein
MDGVAIIPDILLQTDKTLNVWAFVGTAESGYTKISKEFVINKRNKPAEYVFTPVEQITMASLLGVVNEAKDIANSYTKWKYAVSRESAGEMSKQSQRELLKKQIELLNQELEILGEE